MDAKLHVVGLAELNRALRAVDPAAAKQLRLALNDVAGDFVTRVRPLIPTRSGRAARSLKARSTRTSARVAVGGRAAPYYPWLDFGGRTGRNRSVERRYYAEGRYIYPTLRRVGPDIQGALADRLGRVIDDAGLEA